MRVAVAALAVLATLLPLYRAGFIPVTAPAEIEGSSWLMSDFRSVVYYPARAFADGVNPYQAEEYLSRYPAPEPFRAYPPATLLVHQPYAMLEPAQAMRVQVAVILGLTALLAWMSLSQSGLRPHLTGVVTLSSLVLLSRPGNWNLLQGQITLVPVLATYAALVLGPGKTFLQSLALAGAMLKPNFGLPLAVLMLTRRQWPAVIGGLGITALLNIPVLAVLSERSGGFVRATALLVGGPGRPEAADLASQYSMYRVDAPALLSRLAGRSLGPVIPVLIAGLVLGIAAYALRRGDRWPAGERSGPAVGLICTAMLLCMYHIGYDLLLLTWPATAIVADLAVRDASSRRRWLQLGLVGVLAANYLGSMTGLQLLGSGPALLLVVFSLNGIALVALFALYVQEALARELHVV